MILFFVSIGMNLARIMLVPRKFIYFGYILQTETFYLTVRADITEK